jgi:hypothetical protein
MKVIVAGGRDYADFEHVTAVLKSHSEITEVVSGLARGADMMGWNYAFSNDIPIEEFPADWEHNGKAAGILRNKEMGDYAEALIAFWDGKSKGTKHMIDYMKSLNKPVTVYPY